MQIKTIATVLVSSLVLSGCSLLPGQGGQSEAPETDAVMQKEAGDVGSETMLKEDAMVKDDAMDGKDAMMKAETPKLIAENFTFGTEEIRVKQGEKLTVSVMNKSGFHDFVIDELSVDSGNIPEGETMEIEIPTDKPGIYEYYCSVGNHRALGMKGTLIIE